LTYPASWEAILKAAKSVYDYYDGLEVLVDYNLIEFQSKEDILKFDESSKLTFRGMSTIIKAPIIITFYNQLDIIDVNVLMTVEEFDSADYEKFNKSLCTYLDSIELTMHRIG